MMRKHSSMMVGVEELRRILSNGFENITRLALATSENYIGVISLQPLLAFGAVGFVLTSEGPKPYPKASSSLGGDSLADCIMVHSRNG